VRKGSCASDRANIKVFNCKYGMKNILLKTLFPIMTNRGPFADHVGSHTWGLYREMQSISIQSARRYLQGNWELVDCQEPPQQTLTEAFQTTARITEQIYRDHGGLCRILYTDPDTVFIRPLDPWGRWREFRMFDDKPLEGEREQDYYSCCVRYFPEQLPDSFWQAMRQHTDVLWDHSRYAYEMEMYRQLMWHHNKYPVDLNTPQQDVWCERSVYSHSDVDPTLIPQSIVHLGCSAHVETALEIMRRLSQ